MRVGLMRHRAEFWSVTKGVDEYGIPLTSKKLSYKLPVAVKEISTDVSGDTTKAVLSTVQITMRFNRNLRVDSSMYLVLDGVEYDIVTPPNNIWRLNKYVTFNAVARGK